MATWTYVKKTGVPAGPYTVDLQNTPGVDWTIDDAGNSAGNPSTIVTTDSAVKGALDRVDILTLQGVTGTVTPPPVVKRVVTVDGVPTEVAADGSTSLLPVASKTLVAAPVSTTQALVPGKINRLDGTGGSITGTLPTGQIEGTLLTVEKVDAVSANAIVVTGNIRGAPGVSVSLTLSHESVTFIADTAGAWFPISDHKTLASIKALMDAGDATTVAAVPSLVAAAMAADTSVAAAIQSGVGANIAGRGLTEVAAAKYADDGVTAIDGNGKKIPWMSFGLDGKATDETVIDVRNRAGSPIPTGAPYADGLTLTDATGKKIPFQIADESLPDSLTGASSRLAKLETAAVKTYPIKRELKAVPTSLSNMASLGLNNSNKYALNTWLPATFPGTSPITSISGQGDSYPEASIRPPSSAVMALAVGIATGVHDATLTGTTLAAAKTATLRLIKGLAVTHIATYGAGGWGNVWQADMWAHGVAVAASLLTADLDSPTQTAVNAMVDYEANRMGNFDTTQTLAVWTRYDGVEITPGDSKAEEHAWTAGFLIFAAQYRPAHANAAKWLATGYRYAACAQVRPADILEGGFLHGVSLGDRFDGWNLRQDGIVVNHDRMHPDYVASMCAGCWMGAVTGIWAGRTKIPAAWVHNGERLYYALTDLLLSGKTIYTAGVYNIFYPEGNDWGTHRMAHFALFDIAAHALGLDGTSTTPAATWGALHMQRQLDLQARFSTGQTYTDGVTAEDTYAGREQWVAYHLAYAVLVSRMPSTTRITYAAKDF